MKAILTDETVQVHQEMDENSPVLSTLHMGDEMDLGKVNRKKTATWVEIILLGNQKGYISGETKIFAIKKGQITVKSADLVDAPLKTATVIKTYAKGTILTIRGVEKNEEGTWFKAVDENGTSGFISSEAKIRVVPEYTRSGAVTNIIAGVIFAAIGIFMVVSGKDSTQTVMGLIAYAVIFFGILQGGQGVFEYLRYRKAEAKKKSLGKS